MIYFNQHKSWKSVHFNGHNIIGVYNSFGKVWPESAETIYRWVKTDNVECVEETPSPTNIMFKAKYTNGYVYSVFCNEETTLSSNVTQPNELMTEARIGTCITSIGTDAFWGCGNLINVDIPNSVTTIGDKAFYNCSSLPSVTIPSDATYIGNYAFYYCFSLTSVTIPSSVTTIGDYTFTHCSGLTSIDIPSGITYIGQSAFNSCKSLTNIVLPSSLTTIGNFAFAFCSSLTSLTIPSSVTTIGDNAFDTCTGLTSVTIPSSVTTIGERAFENCSSLTSLTIPNSVTTIGNYAFLMSGSNAMEYFEVLAQNPPTIGGNPFTNHDSVPTIYVPDESLELYKAATGWSSLSKQIKPISQKP